MNDKKHKYCEVAELVCEVVLGAAIGTTVRKTVIPKCDNAYDKAIVQAGTAIGAWMIGRTFSKQFMKFCDAVIGTDFKNITDKM